MIAAVAQGKQQVRNLIPRVAAAGLLVLLFPVILILSFCVLLSMGSPAFFRQERSGLRGRTFVMLKLRSMRDARSGEGLLLPDDQRVTAFGRLLRRSRLDELPGLINILAGELAFVGPRPLLPETIRDLGERGVARGAVRPGLTGWSQVNGNTRLSLDKKVDLDLWYIANSSWWLDLRIMAKTLAVMIFGERETNVASSLDQTSDRTSN